MVKGAFQTSREIFENPIWTDVVKFRIFFYIYGNAVFADDGAMVAGVHLKRGQFLRSYRNLQNDLAYREKRGYKQYSLNTIKQKIDQLVKEGRIKIEVTDYGTLFTVVNYEEYQGFGRYEKPLSERQKNGKRTQSERQVNNNKNDKNVKKDNIPSNLALKDRFELLWKVYPNKKGKDKAFKAYCKAIKEGETDDIIIKGINSYTKEIQIKQTEKRFIAHGSTWFSQKRWQDEYITQSSDNFNPLSEKRAAAIDEIDSLRWDD